MTKTISDQEGMIFCCGKRFVLPAKYFYQLQTLSSMVGRFLIVLQLNVPLKNFSLTITDDYIEFNLIKDKDLPSKWSIFTLFNVLYPEKGI